MVITFFLCICNAQLEVKQVVQISLVVSLDAQMPEVCLVILCMYRRNVLVFSTKYKYMAEVFFSVGLSLEIFKLDFYWTSKVVTARVWKLEFLSIFQNILFGYCFTTLVFCISSSSDVQLLRFFLFSLLSSFFTIVSDLDLTKENNKSHAQEEEKQLPNISIILQKLEGFEGCK